jgi:hypothetical protein
MKRLLIGTVTLLSFSSLSWASIIFDDFNTGTGHFASSPTASGTTSHLLATSTTTWDSTAGDALEGAGCNQIIANHDATASSSRVRFLSGGGAPASNLAFTTTAGTDGYIGFYVKAVTTASGWTVSINLDGGTGAAADMDGSSKVSVITDGSWHLYEWDLDSTTAWGAVTGIGGGHGTAVANNTHTIDSIYFYNTGTIPANDVSTFYLDFVAKSDSGSIAPLVPTVPEPSTLALALLGGIGLLVGRQRRG